jgi:hypothetical protein
MLFVLVGRKNIEDCWLAYLFLKLFPISVSCRVINELLTSDIPSLIGGDYGLLIVILCVCLGKGSRFQKNEGHRLCKVKNSTQAGQVEPSTPQYGGYVCSSETSGHFRTT